jgi:hypothetical protein
MAAYFHAPKIRPERKKSPALVMQKVAALTSGIQSAELALADYATRASP